MKHALRVLGIVGLLLAAGILGTGCCGESWDDDCYYVGWDPYYGDIWDCKPDGWAAPDAPTDVGAATELGILVED